MALFDAVDPPREEINALPSDSLDAVKRTTTTRLLQYHAADINIELNKNDHPLSMLLRAEVILKWLRYRERREPATLLRTMFRLSQRFDEIWTVLTKAKRTFIGPTSFWNLWLSMSCNTFRTEERLACILRISLLSFYRVLCREEYVTRVYQDSVRSIWGPGLRYRLMSLACSMAMLNRDLPSELSSCIRLRVNELSLTPVVATSKLHAQSPSFEAAHWNTRRIAAFSIVGMTQTIYYYIAYI